jgi:hypothetical protein
MWGWGSGCARNSPVQLARSEPRAASPFTGDKITGIDLIADPERLRDIDLLVPADHIR